MKKIKTKLLYLLLIIFLILSFISCRYDEGPAISFRTPEKRLEGLWTVQSFHINNIDCTYVYKNKCNCNFLFHISESGYRDGWLHGCIGAGPNDISYGYELINKKKELKIWIGGAGGQNQFEISYFGPIGTSRSAYWTIHRLTNKEMKLSTNYEGNDYVIEFEKQ